MRKQDKITISIFATTAILSLINLVYISYVYTHPKELKLQSIEKTENSIMLHINDQELNISKEKLEEYFLVDMENIIDWNTDGAELALSLKNGNELYTTQTEKIYIPKFKQYVGFEEIKDVRETDIAFYSTTKDGSTYTIDK